MGFYVINKFVCDVDARLTATQCYILIGFRVNNVEVQRTVPFTTPYEVGKLSN